MRIVDDLRGDTCFFRYFGKARRRQLVRRAVGAVAQIDNVLMAESGRCSAMNGRLPDCADRVDLSSR